MTHLAVIGMGGTIAMAPSASGGIVPSLDADDLVASVPGLADLDVHITATTLRSLPSPSLGFADLVALSGRVRAEVAAGAGGATLDVRGWAPGAYVVRASSGAWSATARLVVAR